MRAETRRLRIAPGTGLAVAAAVCVSGATMRAQQLPIGSVSLADATVAGAASTANDRAVLVGNGSVTAKDRVAYVQLFRGGSVAVCATSGLHLTSGAPATPPAPLQSPEHPAVAAENITSAAVAAPTMSTSQPPLMLALDRGAVELRMSAIANDILMTPDLRFEFSPAGQLDLRVRVARNGDTCVENRVAGLSEHPTLRVTSLFGSDTYDVLPGQHVLFEHASLHEVVDNESSPCGCPEQAAVPETPSLAGNVLPKPSDKTSSAQAAELHPFPTAVSQGLAPPPEVPQAAPGVTHTQIAATLVYSGDGPGNGVGGAGKKSSAAAAPRPGFFHSVGRFFKKLFSEPANTGPGVAPHN